MPPRTLQSVNQRIAALLVYQANLLDAVLRPVQSLNRGDLDRLKKSVVGIALVARQGVDDVLVTDREANAPAGHVVALRQREELDAHILGAGHLKKTRRVVTVEGY